MCLATARFVDGAILPRIDLKGYEDPLDRNRHNNCRHKQSVSLQSWKFKKWIGERLKNGPIKEPRAIQKEHRNETEKPTEKKTIESEIEDYIDLKEIIEDSATDGGSPEFEEGAEQDRIIVKDQETGEKIITGETRAVEGSSNNATGDGIPGGEKATGQ